MASQTAAMPDGSTLTKPDYIDSADVDVINTNMDKIVANINAEHERVSSIEASHNAGAHNCVYRGKYLGSSVTADQWAAIKNGTFNDLFVGDYWTINDINWRIAGFNYWYNTGDTTETFCETNHVVIVPDKTDMECVMNKTNTTAGAYAGSDFFTGGNNNTGRATAITATNNAFGSEHILLHRELFTNATTNGAPSDWAWYDSKVDLMSEQMVYGTRVWGNQGGTGNGYDIGIDKSQLPLFMLDPSCIKVRDSWWLRTVVSATEFSMIGGAGNAGKHVASDERKIRFVFGIFQS